MTKEKNEISVKGLLFWDSPFFVFLLKNSASSFLLE